ncbi:uncharacterized protein LOC132712781 [Ruditapes philippinarum]|uniref:uncharacterized protein LOC132712781 n=1 Tax=Ruditapes philippinarum TaxID=129788 RepID=UPI00295B62A9|nr:uncharacterized protein LOC132712781 [Ruditapes philippinarum]
MTDSKKSYVKISGLTIKECSQHRKTWSPKYGEKLLLACEDLNDTSRTTTDVEVRVFEVLRTDNGQTVGQAPSGLCSYFSSFLKEGGHITAEVTNTKFKTYDNVQEINCDYILQGPYNPATEKIINDLKQALQGPGFELYSPTLIFREDEYCCYFHHAVSKAPDLEAKCKAMSKYPKRIRTRAPCTPHTSNVDPRCSYHENSTLQRKHVTETTQLVTTDNVPKYLTRQRSRKIITSPVSASCPAESVCAPLNQDSTPLDQECTSLDQNSISLDKVSTCTPLEQVSTTLDQNSTALEQGPMPMEQTVSTGLEEIPTPLDPKNETQKNADVLPEELDNDPWTRQIYESSLEQGQEVDFTMRLMIIGCYGQGKTSLAKRLMGQSAEGVETTNGIEVNKCEILDEGFKWEQKVTEDAATECIKRLVSISKSNSSASLKSLNTDEEMDMSNEIDTQSDKVEDENVVTDMDIDTNSCVDLKVKREGCLKFKGTNKARVEKEQDKMDSDKTKISTNSARKRIDSANVKRFSTELRKSISFEKQSSKENTKTLSIWDFGGQFVYYATHQLFHSRHAIYLLVFSLNESLDTVITDNEKPRTVKPKTMKEYIKFWISSVHSFVGNNQGTEPTVILVGTKKDLLNPDVDIEQKFEDVRKLFDGSKMLHHLLPDHFAVSNFEESSKEITKLCECVNYLIHNKCQNNLISARWIPLERKLKENRDLKIVNFKTVLEYNNDNEVPVEDEDEVKLFLKYHHARGTFFYFDDGEASQVVLEPQYIVDAFKCLLTSERFCIVRPSLRESWHKLCGKAILDQDLLHDVWGKDPQLDFLKFEDVLIFFLRKHRIIAEALKFEDSNTTVHPESLGFFIVPSLLSKPDEGLIETFMKGKERTQVSIVYVFENESVIPTLFYKVVAAACGQWPLIEFLNEPLIFENAVLYKLSLDQAGLLKMDRNTIEILGIGLCPPHKVNVKDCDMFRRFVEMVIGQEFRKFRDNCSTDEEHSMYTQSIRCYHKTHGMMGSKNTVDLESLKQANKRRTGCPDHENHSLRGNKIVKEWYKIGIDTRSIPQRRLRKCELSEISMMMEENWQHLGIQLGFDKGEIEQIDMITRLTTSMKIFEMLSRWDNREIENATLNVLIAAMNKCKKVLKTDKDVLRNIIDNFDS